MIRTWLLLTLAMSSSFQRSGLGAPLSTWIPKGAPKLSLLGETQFRRQGVPYVEQAYFVDAVALRKHVGPEAAGPELQAAMLEGKAWLACRIRILVSISAAKRREFLLTNLKAHWVGKPFSPDRPDVREFLAFNGRLLNEQDTYDYLFAPSGALHIHYPGGPTRTFTSPELVGAFRRVEFSDDPENPDVLAAMSRELAKRP